MAGISLYDIAVPTFTNGITTFKHILEKAEAFAKEQGLDVNSDFAQAHLIQDQNPFIFQVQNATKSLKFTVGRLTGVELEPFQNIEKTFEDLHARLDAAAELLKTVDPKVVNSRVDEIVDVPVGGIPVKLSVKDAVLGHGIPNFIFHITTGYSILRAKGVPLGKADFICGFAGVEIPKKLA